MSPGSEQGMEKPKGFSLPAGRQVVEEES